MKKENKKKDTNDSSDKFIQELLKSAIIKHISEDQSKQALLAQESQRDLEGLSFILNEYLKNYIIVAHDLLGNEVVLSYANTPNDKNAVTKLFHETFIKMMIPPMAGR